MLEQRSTMTELLELEATDRDVFVGAAAAGPGRSRTFGGLIAAQALAAATRTVRPTASVHSLHAYFLRPGMAGAATSYTVDRVREGRSFVTRGVTASQGGETIFTMQTSFQDSGSDGPEHADPAPQVADPDQPGDCLDTEFDAIVRAEFPSWEVRRVAATAGQRPVEQRVWFRHRERLSDDPVLQACALTYATDMTLLACSAGPHRDGPELQMASLDHAVWFLRPLRVDQWLLYDQSSPSAGYARGLNQGRIFDTDGRLVAHVVQEGLVRFARR